MTGAIVDGVAYSVPQLRALIRERHDLDMELALCRDTLRLVRGNQPGGVVPMNVYLAGPMRRLPAFNFPAFHDAAKALRERGHEVFNPAEADENNGFDPSGMTGHEDLSHLGFDLRSALGADLAFICHKADAVVVLDGWERSLGATAEVATARALGLPVLTIEEALA